MSISKSVVQGDHFEPVTCSDRSACQQQQRVQCSASSLTSRVPLPGIDVLVGADPTMSILVTSSARNPDTKPFCAEPLSGALSKHGNPSNELECLMAEKAPLLLLLLDTLQFEERSKAAVNAD